MPLHGPHELAPGCHSSYHRGDSNSQLLSEPSAELLDNDLKGLKQEEDWKL
jgi:hypothetical protein